MQSVQINRSRKRSGFDFLRIGKSEKMEIIAFNLDTLAEHTVK